VTARKGATSLPPKQAEFFELGDESTSKNARAIASRWRL
jgi:hypothetical protein